MPGSLGYTGAMRHLATAWKRCVALGHGAHEVTLEQADSLSAGVGHLLKTVQLVPSIPV